MIGWGVELMMVMDEGWKGDDWLSVGWPDIVWWWYGGEDDMRWYDERRQEMRDDKRLSGVKKMIVVKWKWSEITN